MIGPKTENTIEGGNGNTQFGHNSGNVYIGLTPEQHEAGIERAIVRKEADLERAHVAEKALIQAELDELHRRHGDLAADYRSRLQELAETKVMLERFDNHIDRARFDEAISALDRDDQSLAVQILEEIAARKALRREDEAREEAKIHFKLGEIAESRVDWLAAARHFSRAAELDANYDTLIKAGELLYWADQFDKAETMNRKLVETARVFFGEWSLEIAKAYNNLAESLRKQEKYGDAVEFLILSLERTEKLAGPNHLLVAVCLNNLATVRQCQKEFSIAEGLFCRSLDIRKLNENRDELMIAESLNNFGKLYDEWEKYSDATPKFLEALVIFRARCGDRHPKTRHVARNTLSHLRTRAPDHPERAELEAVFGVPD